MWQSKDISETSQGTIQDSTSNYAQHWTSNESFGIATAALLIVLICSIVTTLLAFIIKDITKKIDKIPDSVTLECEKLGQKIKDCTGTCNQQVSKDISAIELDINSLSEENKVLKQMLNDISSSTQNNYIEIITVLNNESKIIDNQFSLMNEITMRALNGQCSDKTQRNKREISEDFKENGKT
jgi:hypothetical protein